MTQCCENPDIVVETIGTRWLGPDGPDDNLCLVEYCTSCGHIFYDESEVKEIKEIPF